MATPATAGAALDRSFDVVVVGTGPGGATVAREVARSGASVLVLERGGAAPPTGQARQALRELWTPGRSFFLTGSVMVVRGVTLGGSSMYFFGTAWPPPFEALKPFGLDLEADTRALQSELAPAPLPRDLMGPRALAIMDSARALGFDWKPIPKFIDQAALRAGRSPLEARWNARRHVEQAVSAGATLVTGARVERVLVEGGSARGVEVALGRARRTVLAGRVVVAAGGLGSPVILRASGIARAGTDWFYDPVTAVVGEVDGLDAGPELPMVAAADLVDEKGYMLTDLCRPMWMHRALAVTAGRPDRIGGYRRSLCIMVKSKDDLSGAMTGRGAPGKPLTRADRARLEAGTEDARAVLRQAGARHVYRAGFVAVHPGGTAKVGDVVDADLQTEIRGLFVCDASVIPTAWGLPPTLTVMALGRRLGRRLAGDGSRPAPAEARVPLQAEGAA